MPLPFTVRFWGVRGSVPTPGGATRHHGGNTSCVSVHDTHNAEDRVIVLDAGTGVRLLGERLVQHAPPNGSPNGLPSIDLFLTHAHWDHLQGLPFFAPFYVPGARVTIHAPDALRESIERVVRAQMRPPAFPIAFESLPATVTFRSVDLDAGVTLGDTWLQPIAARHPGGAVGWRVQSTHDTVASVVYLPDNEIADVTGARAVRDAWVAAIRGARLLVHDATYTPAELPQRLGWGHSSWDEALRLAVDAEVERLVLFHHYPDRSDADVDQIVDLTRTLAASLGSTVRVLGAAEGLTLHA